MLTSGGWPRALCASCSSHRAGLGGRRLPHDPPAETATRRGVHSPATTVRRRWPRKGHDRMFTARHQIVREAANVVLRHLDDLPPSDRTEQLRVWVEECVQEIERWDGSPPTPRERDAIAKRLLAIHAEVTRLERRPGQPDRQSRRRPVTYPVTWSWQWAQGARGSLSSTEARGPSTGSLSSHAAMGHATAVWSTASTDRPRGPCGRRLPATGRSVAPRSVAGATACCPTAASTFCSTSPRTPGPASSV